MSESKVAIYDKIDLMLNVKAHFSVKVQFDAVLSSYRYLQDMTHAQLVETFVTENYDIFLEYYYLTKQIECREKILNVLKDDFIDINDAELAALYETTKKTVYSLEDKQDELGVIRLMRQLVNSVLGK